MKNKVIRLGVAGALTALSMAALAVPAQASICGPVVDSIKMCTADDGSSYPVLVNAAVTGPRPGIGGALLVGNTLTVFDGSWDPADATRTHQWLRNDVPVLGATGPTYLLTTADLDKGIRVKTTAAAPGYAKTTVQSTKTAAVTNAGGAIPSVKAPVTVTFTGRDSDTDAPNPIVDAQPGNWSGAPDIAFHYQWLREGTPIPGANAATFDTTDWGPKALLSVRITGYAAGYDPASVTSAARLFSSWNPIPGAVVTGGTGLGDVLTGVDDVPWRDFNGRGETDYPHRYKWLRDGAPIPGATELTYAITAEDQGHTLVLMTDSDVFNAYSNPTVILAAADLLVLTNVSKPVLTGDAITGTPMTASAGTWSKPSENLTITYLWLAGDRIAGSGPTYTPGTADVGKTVSVLVTAGMPGYVTTRIRVAAPKPVTIPDPTQTKAPAVSGNPVVGAAISVSGGAWSDRGSEVKKAFQWLRDGAPIKGATGRNFTPAGADFGKNLSVTVTCTLGGRTLKTQTVDAPAKVAVGTLQTGTPTMTGTAKVGTALTAVPGSWTKGTVFKYRWLRNGVTISNAFAATYKVRTADRNARITLRVTGSLLGYTTASRVSGAFIAR